MRKVFLILFCLFIGCKENPEVSVDQGYKKDTASFPQNCTGVKKDVSVLWKFNPEGAPIELGFGATDANWDGRTEIIGLAWDKLYILKGDDGKILWTHQIPINESVIDFFGIPVGGCLSYVIGEVEGDGKEEVVTFCADGNVYAFNGEDGSVLWKVSKNFIPYSMGDIDGDGRYEVIGVMWKEKEGESEEVKISAINGENGSLLWESQVIPSSVFNAISLGDLNGDKLPDVVLGCGHPDERCGVIALNGKNGSLLWSYTYPEKEIGAVVTPPVLGDIDEDGKLEVVAVTYEHDIYAFNGEDGSLLWHHEDSPVGGDYYSIALAKVKGKFRIIGHGGVVLNEKGEVMINKKEDGMTGPYFPIIGDVDGDGRLDTIVYKIESISNGEFYQLKIYAVDIEDGSEHLIYEGEEKREEDNIYHFLLADVNNDCVLDLLLSILTSGTGNSEILALSLGVPVPPPHLLPWPMARHDVKNTGLYTGDPYPPW
jgi:outer membrane protein assembly factor BamB